MLQRWESVWTDVTDKINNLLAQWQTEQPADPAQVEEVRREFSRFRDHLIALHRQQQH